MADRVVLSGPPTACGPAVSAFRRGRKDWQRATTGTPFIWRRAVGLGMDVRDAVEADADRLGELADGPQDVMRNLVHDRTVRVAVEGTGEGEECVTGFVSFDARAGTVHVTQLAGNSDALERLLEEPIGFADREGMAVELLVPEDEGDVRTAAEDAEFERAGSGPRFEGTPTTRYRLETGKARQ